MYKNIALIISLLFFLNINAQTGRIVYKNNPQLSDSLKNEIKKNPETRKEVSGMVKEFMAAAPKFNYVLNFNDDKSLFEIESILTKNATEKMIIKSQSSYYTNLSTQTILEQKEIAGTTFLIKKEATIDWKITNEKKKIGDYLAQKAVTHKEVINTRTDNVIKHKVIAWFTPEIPINYGPDGYHGLPGLILKLEIGGFTNFVIHDIDLGVSNPKVKKPTKGKKVTEEEYIAIKKRMSGDYRDFKN